MVLIQQDGPDLAFVDWERRKNTEATRIWATHFSLSNPNSIYVSIPSEWANFFIVMLTSPANFYWAKEFLSSKATLCLKGMGGLIDYSLHKVCPTIKGLSCSSSSSYNIEKRKLATSTLEEVQEETSDIVEQQTSTKKPSNRKRAPVVENEVRRSPRLKTVYNRSKPSICSDKKCLTCSPSPPTLSSKLIRNLGT